MAGERGANDLFEYIRQFILSPGMGYGYVFTNAMLIMAAVMLLRDFPKNKKGIAQFFIEYLVCCAYSLGFPFILADKRLADGSNRPQHLRNGVCHSEKQV